MRHHYTTYLSEQGIPDNVIQEILGWSDISLVSVYRDTDVVAEIGKYFCDGEIVSKETIDMRNL